MIRFLLDQFRNMPGPLKKPRILVADLAEEVLDIAEHLIKKNDSSGLNSSCCAPTGASSDSAPSPGASSSSSISDAAPVAEMKSTTSSPADGGIAGASVVDARLVAAIAVPGNIRKQEFKVLAILWDAYNARIGALSAKAISKRGEDVLKVQIRHENVRKVIRMRLENYVKVHAQGVGNGTVYNYELSEAGAEYFVSTYLK